MEKLLFLSLNSSLAWGLITGGIFALLGLFLLICYRVLAPRNIFFTFGRENRAMYVMTGKKFSGKVIMPSQTLYVDEKDQYSIKEIKSDSNIPELPLYSKLSGMYWIGVYPFRTIYERRQQWHEWKSTANGREIIFRDEMTPYLIAKPFEYAMYLSEAEDMNGVPLNVTFTVILMPTNARRPIFDNADAYGQVETLCLGEALLFIKEKTFANFGSGNSGTKKKIKENDAKTDFGKIEITNNDDFCVKISELNKEIPGRIGIDPNNPKIGLEEALGYKIIDAKLNSIEIAGTHKDAILEATTAKYVAGENAKAKIEEAKGNLKATRLDAQGKKVQLAVQSGYLKNISDIPGAMDVEKKKATPGLTTLVEADSGKNTSLLVGGGK